MSDIIVKQLAELIGAPVDSLLQQLKDADIKVSGPDDSITDRQKLKLLEFIRTGQKTTTTDAEPKKAGGKISLKRRSSTEIKGAQGKGSVSVEVRRKKNLTRTPAATETAVYANEIEELTASGNRSGELAEQLSNERKAREDAMDKNKADREDTSERKSAEKSERDAAKQATEEESATPVEETSAETETEAPKTEEVVAEVAPVVEAPLVLPKDPKERREFLAKRARDEAAAKFKRRPSPVRLKPKPAAPAPTTSTAAPNRPGNTTSAAAPGNNANKGKKKPFQGRNSGPGQLHVKEGANRRKKKGKRTRNVKIDQSTEHGFVAPTEPLVRSIAVPDTIVVSELAQMLSV